jgi:hypothetical protein
MPAFVGQNFGTAATTVHDGEDTDIDDLRVNHNYGLIERHGPRTTGRSSERSKQRRKFISVPRADFGAIKSWLQTREHDHPHCSGGEYGSHT